MARFSSQYKQNRPTRRTVAGENSYEKGMYFSEGALDPGFVHTLLNLEIDQLSFTVNVTGGLHTTDVAAGCTFIDRAIFDTASDEVIVLQGRNEYCARAFEGITNIIGIQKLAVKNNQTLAEQLRQQGFTANDVVCYKILTYNPINYRLMSVTMIQARRDKYFTVSPDYSLRRLQVNPISCGSSEVWTDPVTSGTYVSNLTDYHPSGATDTYLPRIRRNMFDETYGQVLHSSHYMQTVAHCEGFGNKTFLFTNKKQVQITGQIVNRDIVQRANVYSITEFSAISNSFRVGDILTVTPSRSLEVYEAPLVIRITDVGFTVSGTIRDAEWVNTGTFKWNGSTPDTAWTHTVMRGSTNVTSSVLFSGFVVTRVAINSIIVGQVSATRNTQYDIYLRNCNTGADEAVQASLNNEPVAVDAYRFGIVLTSVALLVNGAVLPTPTVIAPDDLYNTALINPIKNAGTSNTDKEVPCLEVNLNDGTLRVIDTTAFSFSSLPILRGTGTVSNPVDPVTGLFKPDTVSSTAWFHPSSFINEDIIAMLRVAQGFRIAVFAKSVVALTRKLNTLRGDPLKSEYYDEHPTAVWVLDYIWTGIDWECSFVDTRKTPTPANTTLVENWESRSTTRDALNNKIVRHYIWLNCLSYTDVITTLNQEKMAVHLVDEELSARQIYDKTTNIVTGSSNFGLLTYNLDETLDERLGQEEFDNKSKLFDTAYGHFEVEPTALEPSQASLWGYNMLSPTPYLFKCEDTPNFPPVLTGVLLMRNKQPLLKPLVNTAGVLFVFFNADSEFVRTIDPKNYQLKVEYKNPNDDWRPLKIYDVDDTHYNSTTNTGLASKRPFEIPFTSPDESVLIRLQIIDTLNFIEVAHPDKEGEMVKEFLIVSSLISTLNYTKDPAQVETNPATFDLGSALGITYWKARLVAWGILGAENMLFSSEGNRPEYWPYPTGTDIFEENIVHVVSYSDALIVFTSTKLWRIDLQADGLSWKKTLLQQNLRIIDKDIPYIRILKNMLFFKSDKQFYMLVPARGSTVGELTIAPISKPISEFLKNPFKALKSLIPAPYKELTNSEKPLNEYLVKYGTHIEQMRIFVNWWFDLTSFKAQAPHISDQEVDHEVLKTSNLDDNPKLLVKEYWLVQLVYDAQTYSWSMRTHTTNKIGEFISDAANIDTDFVSLVFSPELTRPTNVPIFTNGQGFSYSKATWGLEVAHRRTPEEALLQQFTLEPIQVQALLPTYPRFQIFDTGYKEVSNPALNKRFREAQLFLEPEASKAVTAVAPADFLQQLIDNDVPDVSEEPDLIAPYMYSTPVDPTTGDSVALKALLDVYVDGNQILMSSRPEVTYELQSDDTLQIKITDAYNFIEGPFTVNAELSNTFILDSSALTGLKLVRFRRTINGKGQHIRMRFTNLTETNYSLVGHAFVAHNKNAR